MEKLIVLDKPVGLTPLQLIRIFQKQYPHYGKMKLGYVGRLDPMAEGVLLVLCGDENKQKKAYEKLPKTYTFAVLFGIATDTYDQLGLVTKTPPVSLTTVSTQLPAIIEQIQTKKEQVYPPYSSRTVQGKPLFWWARQKKLSDISIPTHQITINDLRMKTLRTIDSETVAKQITKNIHRVTGNFRQVACLTAWQSYFSKHREPLVTATCQITCSSGTYIRSICHDMGELLGTGAIALQITRVAVGPYTRSNALALFPQLL